MSEQIYKGIGSGSGFAVGPAIVIHRGELVVPHNKIHRDDTDSEIERLQEAKRMTHDQLFRIRSAVAKAMGEDAAGVIDAQLLVLSDPAFIDETGRIIVKRMVNAEHAFDTVMQGAMEALKTSESNLFRERVQDLQDVRRRILANLMGIIHQVIPIPERESILVTNNLAPSETAHLFGSKYVGLVAEIGGFTSHVAIMSRTMDLPAVLGIENVTELVSDNTEVIVDSMRGQIIVAPDKKKSSEYVKLRKLYIKRRHKVMEVKSKESSTPDGHRIAIAANMELPEEVPLVKHYGAEGIGLFRTELLYGGQESLPDEDMQFDVYRNIVKQVNPHAAILRTFDIGGDKLIGIFGHQYEANPFLGLRAIRIGLLYPDILKTQLRALLRASAFGKLKIMFPMISIPEEMRQAREILEEVKEELKDKKIPFDDTVEVGAMVEVPSAAIFARELALYCDFLSIGSNDLVQYTLAADRGNPRVAHIYQAYHPAVLKLIKYTIDAGHLMERWVGLCGEMAGETTAIPMLLGMGLDEFSTVPARVPLVKYVIRHVKYTEARRIAETVLRFSTQDEVQSYLMEQIHKLLPSAFFDAE